MEVSEEILGIVMLIILLAAIFVGFPISFTLIVVALAFGYFSLGDMVFQLMVSQTFGFMQSDILAAVPLFIFMGYITEQAGLMERLFVAFRHILAPLRGSLYLVVILTSAIFAMATGIVGASVTVLGIMAGPTMIKCGYNERLSSGAITAGGTLGILIPPSVMLIVLGPIMNVSVGKLYAAAFGPGFLLALLYIIYTLIRSFLKPDLGPPMPVEDRIASKSRKIRLLLTGILPLAVLILATLGSIMAGLATPTEAAGIGSSGAIILSLVYRNLTWRKLRNAAMETVQTTSMIMLLAVASNIFGAVFAALGSGEWLTNSLLQLPLSPNMILLMIMVLIFLLGWPFEWPAIVYLFLPLFLPVIQALKFDLLWFGIIVAVNLQTAFLSPPVAMAAYYLRAVVPDWKLSAIYMGMLQFMVLQVIGLILILIFPEIVLWVPRMLFK